jgi:HD-GYP domain-containing protein (c-di-GMP phosphodiesterase class II)/DNA-binding CsgD family transcriptional regulator
VDDDLRLADLLAALSVATDLGMGHEPEKAVRSCVLATELARAAGLPEARIRDVYYTSMLQHLGCTASSHELTYLFGDDRPVLAQAERTDESTLRGTAEMFALVGRGTGLRRPQHLGRVLRAGPSGNETILRSVCEVGGRMAERLHLGEGVRAALQDGTETWDGRGGAYGRAGEDITLPARFALLSAQAVLFDGLGGPEAALDVVRGRAERWFDPALVAIFVQVGPDLLRQLDATDVWEEVLAVEPRPVKCVPSSRIDEIAHVFADMVDLKSSFTLGHSSGVAELAAQAGERLGFPPERVTTLRRAALLHDLGRVAVSNAVWERPGRLTSTQWEQVRLHPYQTERILDRSSGLAHLSGIAGMHHERQDGTGYHHGVAGSAVPTEARILAAADTFQAMTQDRPHRPAVRREQAAEQLERDGVAGGLEAECVGAVVEAVGLRATRGRRSWPAGLTDREVEVLRLMARGSSNREIASQLVVSRRTAEHHVQHIYTKIGGSTRAAAAVFAMEHDLLR